MEMPSDATPMIDETLSGRGVNAGLDREAQAAQILCEALWETLHLQIRVGSTPEAAAGARGGGRQRTAELAERVADVASAFALLASADRDELASPGGDPPASQVAPGESRSFAPAQSDPVLIDEGVEMVRGPARVAGGESSRQPGTPRARSRAWRSDSRATARPPAISVSDSRRGRENGYEPPPAPIDLIAIAVERFERDRLPFAVLLIEALEFEELHCGLPLDQMPRLVRQLESVSSRALEAIGARTSAALALEGATRMWLQIPEMDRRQAASVAQWLMGSAERWDLSPSGGDPAERYFATLSEGHRSPHQRSTQERGLELAIGTAVCPQDGVDAASLIQHANRELVEGRGGRRPSARLKEMR